MTLAALGVHFSFSRSELESLTIADLGFWSAALTEYLRRTKPKGGT